MWNVPNDVERCQQYKIDRGMLQEQQQQFAISGPPDASESAAWD